MKKYDIFLILGRIRIRIRIHYSRKRIRGSGFVYKGNGSQTMVQSKAVSRSIFVLHKERNSPNRNEVETLGLNFIVFPYNHIFTLKKCIF